MPFTPAADQTNSRGLFVENSSGNVAIVNAATDVPVGVIVDGQPTTGKSAVALCGSGAIVKVKCAATAGTIVLGTYLTLDGTTLGAVAADAGTGARVRVARALEAGANNALIDAILIDPAVLS
jgi:hypothetical protein